MQNKSGRHLQKILLLFYVATTLIFICGCKDKDVKYSIELKFENVVNGETLYLQKYSGKTLITIDSIAVSSSENVLFNGNDYLDPGMYALTLNKKMLVNFFITDNNNQKFSVSLNTKNPALSIIFKDSPENQAFIYYLRFLLRNQLTKDEIRQKGDQLQDQYPGSMLDMFIQTMKEPEVSEDSLKNDNNLSEFECDELENHYFDNVDFTDQRLLNTPLLEQKIDFYFKHIVHPLPDYIIDRVDQTLEKAKVNKEVFNWMARYLYNLYREMSIEGNADVYNYIGENYILTEPAQWDDSLFVENVSNRVAKAKLNPIGKKATNLILLSPNGKKVNLHNVISNYTVLFFYNPECEACKSVSAELNDFSKQYRSKGIEVFAIYLDQKKDIWAKAIASNDVNWINVYDSDGTVMIEEKYDINALPMIYLLDKNKNVIAKDVPVYRLKEYITN